MSVTNIFNDAALAEGWSNDTQFELLLQFIERLEDSGPFEKFIESKVICRQCGNAGCYKRCPSTGKHHDPDPASGMTPGGVDTFIIDYRCKHCGELGSVGIVPEDIDWD